VNGNKPDLVPLAFDAEMHHALPALQVAQPQQAQLLSSDAVIEQGGQYCPVPYTLQRVWGRGLQEPTRLGVTQRRRNSPIISRCGTIQSINGIAGDRQSYKERAESFRWMLDGSRSGDSRCLRHAIVCARVTLRSSSGSVTPVKAENSSTSFLYAQRVLGFPMLASHSSSGEHRRVSDTRRELTPLYQ